MEFVIKVKDTVFKKAVANRVHYILEDFDTDAIKAAGFKPDCKELIANMINDPKFIEFLSKEFSERITENIDDILLDAEYKPFSSIWDKILKEEEKIFKDNEYNRKQNADKIRLETALQTLKDFGYNVDLIKK